VALTIEPIDVLYVWSTIRQQRQMSCFLQGSAATYYADDVD